MGTLTARIKEEFVAMLPPTMFFLVAVHIIALTSGSSVSAQGSLRLALDTIRAKFGREPLKVD